MRRAAGLLLALALTGCATLPTTGTERARWWLTTADQRQLLVEQPSAASTAAPADVVIRIDPDRRYQSMVGFGAAITDASADLIQAMPPAKRDALMHELFGRGRDALGLSFTRLPVGASDFSSRHYSLDDSPGNEPDPNLTHYSAKPAERAMLPTARQARAINPDLKVMISPWSAPAWMKTSNSLYKGHLKPSAYPAYAEYFARTIESFGRDGVPVYALSVQNEPDFEPENYPGMKMTPTERAAFVGGTLGPLLARRGLGTRILDWDHNWDKPQMPLGTLADPAARRYISGVAWHCYAGDVAAQSPVRDAYPDKDVFFTECSGGEWSPKFGETLLWMTRNLVIGATRNWSRGSLLWNLALDPAHGPHLGGCANCRGVVTIDPATATVTRNVEYYVLAHASRFVRPGAVRIESTGPSGEVENVAFLDPDKGSITVILANAAPADRRVALAVGARQVGVTLPASSVATLVWRRP